MSIVVRSPDRLYKIIIKSGKEKAVFHISPLKYRTKSLIAAETTTLKNGKVSVDQSLNAFLSMKYGLKKVEGIKDEDGNEFELQFEDDSKDAVTEECLEMLFNSSVSDNLVYAGIEMVKGIPKKIVYPGTNVAVEGVEVVDTKKAPSKKK